MTGSHTEGGKLLDEVTTSYYPYCPMNSVPMFSRLSMARWGRQDPSPPQGTILLAWLSTRCGAACALLQLLHRGEGTNPVLPCPLQLLSRSPASVCLLPSCLGRNSGHLWTWCLGPRPSLRLLSYKLGLHDITYIFRHRDRNMRNNHIAKVCLNFDKPYIYKGHGGDGVNIFHKNVLTLLKDNL